MTKATLLLVEDNDSHAYLIERVLRKPEVDFECVRVRDGEEALTYLRRQGPYIQAEVPRAVLLDLKLPKLSGHEVLKTIKEDPLLRRVPVIILTTSDAEPDRLKAYANHANSYVVKSLGFAEFSRVLVAVGTYWATVNRPA